jgi:NAD(P)H-dependent FMN reductase
VISYAEYNGNYTSAWKNLTDWLSRSERKYFFKKPVLILGTSTGPGGARRVLELAKLNAQHVHGRIIDTISLPQFHQHYNDETQSVEHPVVVMQVQQAIDKLLTDLPARYKESVC